MALITLHKLGMSRFCQQKNKRKFQYEEELKANPTNYDAWFDYIRMMEENGIEETTREAYEQAIANVPPSQEKRFWLQYIYLWINYAFY